MGNAFSKAASSPPVQRPISQSFWFAQPKAFPSDSAECLPATLVNCIDACLHRPASLQQASPKTVCCLCCIIQVHPGSIWSLRPNKPSKQDHRSLHAPPGVVSGTIIITSIHSKPHRLTHPISDYLPSERRSRKSNPPIIQLPQSSSSAAAPPTISTRHGRLLLSLGHHHHRIVCRAR
jgi:hypothetical protein